jgi:hypothetical protein
MDNTELFSRICKLDSELFRLRLDASAWVLKICLAMFLGFYLFALFGLYLIHQAYTDSVDEMRRELAAMHAKAPSQVAPAVR